MNMSETRKPQRATARKKVNALLTKLEELNGQIQPSEAYIQEHTFTGVPGDEIGSQLDHFVYRLSTTLNTHKDIQRALWLLWHYRGVFVVFTDKVLIKDGFLPDEAQQLSDKFWQEIYESDFVRGITDYYWHITEVFKKCRFDIAQLQAKSLGATRTDPKLAIKFKNFIATKILRDFLIEELNLTKFVAESQKDIATYKELSRLESGEIKEASLSNDAFRLTTTTREALKTRFRANTELWNKLTGLKGIDLDELMEEVSKEFLNPTLLEIGFADVLELIETQNNTEQSKMLALQPFFHRTHRVKFYREWAAEQGLAIEPGELPTAAYKKYVVRTISSIIGLAYK